MEELEEAFASGLRIKEENVENVEDDHGHQTTGERNPSQQNHLMMTMDVPKAEPPSATAGMGPGGPGSTAAVMSLSGLNGQPSQQQQLQPQQLQQQQQQQQQLIGAAASNNNNQHQVVGAGQGAPGGGGGGGQQQQQQQHAQQQQQQQQQLCAGCGKHIQDRFLLRALDLLWHEDCLKCGCCDCRLGEVGSTLYTKGNLMLCKRDYLRLFGNTGFCAACNKVIPAFEMVMRARNNVYHLECFACQQCNHRFCVGDKFYLCENKILCEYDYEERLVFASMANHPMLKRQISQAGGGPGGGGGGGGPGGGGGVLHPGVATANMQNGHGSGGGGVGGGGTGAGGGGGGGGGPGGSPQQGPPGGPQGQNNGVGNPLMLGGGAGGGGAGQRPVGGGGVGDLNNNNNASLPAGLTGGPSPFGSPTHIKAALSTAS